MFTQTQEAFMRTCRTQEDSDFTQGCKVLNPTMLCPLAQVQPEPLTQ